jgi:hypothetical protein
VSQWRWWQWHQHYWWMVESPQMTMLIANHNPKILTLQLVVFPCLKSLRHHNLTLFKRA